MIENITLKQIRRWKIVHVHLYSSFISNYLYFKRKMSHH